MARCPFATWSPIPIESSARRIKPWGVVMHTAVSNSDALRPWSEVEWHFYIGEQGQLTQFRDTEIEADCQLDGNYFSGRGHISIETWDGAGRVWDGRDVRDIPGWTTEQVAAIGRLLTWLHDTHDIPLQRIQAWNGRGIGYHRQFTSNSYPRWNQTHACPGDRRVAQIDDLIRAAQQQEDDMPLTGDDKSEIRRIVREVVENQRGEPWKAPMEPAHWAQERGLYDGAGDVSGWDAANHMKNTNGHVRGIRFEDVPAVRRAIAANTALLEKLASATSDFTLAEIRQAVTDGVNAAVDSAELARAVTEAIGQTDLQELVEAAIRSVLGSLDTEEQ